MSRLISLSLCSACLVVASTAFADPGGRPPHKPPPEAFEVCEGQAEGDACSLTPPDRDEVIEGTCRIPPQRDVLVCVPNDHRPPPRDR